MKIAIIKYNAGNTQSLLFALERLGVNGIVTNDANEIVSADKVIFPGVGEASSAMAHIKEHNLDQVIKELKQPVLGVCLGMQLMCEHTEEGDTDCLGIFNTKVKRFKDLKVPHVGWNKLHNNTGSLFAGEGAAPYVYFVHSYYAEPGDDTVATTDYGVRFSSALARDNFYGVQFHPEKSAEAGLTVLKNFIAI